MSSLLHSGFGDCVKEELDFRHEEDTTGLSPSLELTGELAVGSDNVCLEVEALVDEGEGWLVILTPLQLPYNSTTAYTT